MTAPTAKGRAETKRARIRRAERGQCARCKAPAAPDRAMCAAHLTQDSARSLARYYRRQALQLFPALLAQVTLGQMRRAERERGESGE